MTRHNILADMAKWPWRRQARAWWKPSITYPYASDRQVSRQRRAYAKRQGLIHGMGPTFRPQGTAPTLHPLNGA